MAELAGKTNKVYILSTVMEATTGAAVLGCDNASYGTLCDILDITSFGDTNYKRMAGLLDGKFSISGNVYTGDTTGQALLIAGNTVFVGIYPSGTAVAGTQVQCIVQSHDLTMPVAGKQTFSTVFSPIAAPVALPAQS